MNATVSLETRHSNKKDTDYQVLVLEIGKRKIELFPGNKASEIEYTLALLDIEKLRKE